MGTRSRDLRNPVAVLSTKTRDKEKASTFGLSSERKYPMPDKAHARNAKARASEMEHKGRLSKSEESKIDAKADRILGRGRSRESHERPEHGATARHGTEKKMLPIKSASERRRQAEEDNALPKPRSERMHMGSKGYDEKKKGGEHVRKTAAAHKESERPRRERAEHHREHERHEPKREARMHERKGEERHERHERVAKEHERHGMKMHEKKEHERREHEKRAEKVAARHSTKVVHHHHWHGK
jgi:hypothetical protein